jgi:uncharacterized membrane protein YjjP (DUF1212 family)
MIRIQTFLDKTDTALLSEYAEKNQCSLSRAASGIISTYLSNTDSMTALQRENKQQFLRLLNVMNQIFLCVYKPEKVSIDAESAKACLDQIKQSVKAYCSDD